MFNLRPEYPPDVAADWRAREDLVKPALFGKPGAFKTSSSLYKAQNGAKPKIVTVREPFLADHVSKQDHWGLGLAYALLLYASGPAAWLEGAFFMMEFGACPRCMMEVSTARRQDSLVVCDHCGHTLSETEILGNVEHDRKFIKISIGISVAIVGAFIQLANWDTHSIEVLPLQAKELVGAASNADHELMAQICLERKKFDCVEKEYGQMGTQDRQQLLRLGKFQMSRAHYQAAVQTYTKFFKDGGIDLDGSYQFARALGQVGMIDDAAKYYDYVLGAKPEVLQVTIVTNYVRLLMDAKRLDQAKKLIEDVRGRSETSAMFMESEFQKIQSLRGSAKS